MYIIQDWTWDCDPSLLLVSGRFLVDRTDRNTHVSPDAALAIKQGHDHIQKRDNHRAAPSSDGRASETLTA